MLIQLFSSISVNSYPNNINSCAHYRTTGTESFILGASNFRLEKPMDGGGPKDPPFTFEG